MQRAFAQKVCEVASFTLSVCGQRYISRVLAMGGFTRIRAKVSGSPPSSPKSEGDADEDSQHSMMESAQGRLKRTLVRPISSLAPHARLCTLNTPTGTPPRYDYDRVPPERKPRPQRSWQRSGSARPPKTGEDCEDAELKPLLPQPEGSAPARPARSQHDMSKC